jgi:phosphatidylinositol alpha-1,6-mannosyltransferase
MRVCVVTWQLEPDSGWGRYSLGLVRGLRERGVRLRVLTERRSPPPVGLGVRAIPCLSMPLSPFDRPLALAWNLAQLFRWARGSDLVHFFVEPYALVASLAFPWPHLITVHGTYGVIPLRGNPITARLFARTMGRARAVVCVSRYTRSRVADALPLDNLEVINNGLEMPAAAGDGMVSSPHPGGEGTLSPSPAAGPVLLGVGALKPRKGYHVAVEALPIVRERYPDVHYYLVGDDRDGGYVRQLREAVTRLGLERNVTITGRVEDAELDALYRRSDAFVLPPVNSGAAFEGFGLTYLEANAYGKPVIGSYDCGAEDAIRDGVNGYLAPQRDSAAVAERILRLLDDPRAAARMGERGRELALARDWSHVAGEYLALYERALGR